MGQSLFRSYMCTIPHLFLCYVDDYIGATSCSLKKFEQFIHFTSIFQPDLKFTWTISDTSLRMPSTTSPTLPALLLLNPFLLNNNKDRVPL
eukprot:g34692.t1